VRESAYDAYNAVKDPAVGLYDAYFGKNGATASCMTSYSRTAEKRRFHCTGLRRGGCGGESCRWLQCVAGWGDTQDEPHRRVEAPVYDRPVGLAGARGGLAAESWHALCC
jgi:hypothetical protein